MPDSHINPGDNLATGQVTLATTNPAVLIVAARQGRKALEISPASSAQFYVGATNAVTTSTGHFMGGTAGLPIPFNTAAAVYGIVATGTLVVTYTEHF